MLKTIRRINLARYDQPVEPLFHGDDVSAIHAQLEVPYRNPDPALAQMSDYERILYFRKLMDQGGQRAAIASSVTPIKNAAVPGEWVMAPNALDRVRLIYLHGGAFTMGSPQSHRILSSRLSELTGAAVYVPDYRLMPEHKRQHCTQDAQQAYRWMLDHGPDGRSIADKVMVAGDSAGGNLALMLLAWARDHGLRQADAAVALSPTVDATMSSPSIRRNLKTDVMLHRMMKPVTQAPRALLVPGLALRMKVNPYDPAISPIFGELHDLPPTLIQASSTETLEDDARRYTNKARAAGSPVQLQIWNGLMHVWHAYEPELPEAKAALLEVGKFLRRHADFPQVACELSPT